MDTLYPSVENVFGGVRLIAKPLKGRLSRSEKELNTIAAKIAQKWLNDPKNKLTISTLLCQWAAYGIAIGMSTGKDVSLRAINYESFVSPATKSKRAKKTS